MSRFISFLSGFLVAVVCGSLLIIEYQPINTGIGSLVNLTPLKDVQVPFEVRDEMVQVAAIYDATKEQLVKSVEAWEKIDIMRFVKSEFASNHALHALSQVDQEQVYAEISEFAIANGVVVEAVEFSEDTGWLVRLERGEKVILGEESLGPRLHRAFIMLDQLPEIEQGTTIAVDARYTNGIAVSQHETLVAMQ